MEIWWNDLGSVELTPALEKEVIAGVSQEVGGRSIEQLDQRLAGARIGTVPI